MKGNKGIQGFTLIECLIAMVMIITCFAAIFSLLTICVKMEVISREMTLASSQARLKMEELKVSVRNPGGNLTSNVTDYFDKPSSRYTRRWQISTDSMGSQTIVVLMTPDNPGSSLSEIRLVTRMK